MSRYTVTLNLGLGNNAPYEGSGSFPAFTQGLARTVHGLVRASGLHGAREVATALATSAESERVTEPTCVLRFDVLAEPTDITPALDAMCHRLCKFYGQGCIAWTAHPANSREALLCGLSGPRTGATCSIRPFFEADLTDALPLRVRTIIDDNGRSHAR